MANRLTEDNNTSPDRVYDILVTLLVLWVSMLKQSCHHPNIDGIIVHIGSGLFIKDAVPIHGVEKNPLQPSPDDKDAEVIAYELNP